MNNISENSFCVQTITLGCKVNQFDSEAISASFHSLEQPVQNRPAPKKEVFVINTCTVTRKAAMQSRQAIRKVIRENPDAIIIATGCYAQSEPHSLKKIKGLDYIIDNCEKHRIAEILQVPEATIKKSYPVVFHHDIRKVKHLVHSLVPVVENRTRPFIKIQDGCDNFCTYCIVPFTRGPSRSVPPADVLHMIASLPAEKRKEIVLTGIHLGKYGLDLSPTNTLLDLLIQIEKSGLVDRIRLSSIEPVELTDALLEYVAHSPVMCRHLHIPLQSGDPQILKKMHRPYDPLFFKKLIQKIYHTIPDVAIGVDIMVGFPGETEDAFMNSAALIADLPVTYLHVFPFSSRPGTAASHYPDHVKPEVIKNRRNHLLKLGKQKKTEFYKKMVGTTLDVLIENKRDAKTKKLSGVSSNYVRVLVEWDHRLKNRIVPCRITRIISPDAVRGEPCR